MNIKKTINFAVILILSFTFSSQSYAMDIENYNKMKHSEETADRAVLKAYVKGLSDGFLWSNAINRKNGDKQFFCRPSKLRLNTENYMSFIDDQLEKHEKNETPIALLLYEGLEEVFPCQCENTKGKK